MVIGTAICWMLAAITLEFLMGYLLYWYLLNFKELRNNIIYPCLWFVGSLIAASWLWAGISLMLK